MTFALCARPCRYGFSFMMWIILLVLTMRKGESASGYAPVAFAGSSLHSSFTAAAASRGMTPMAPDLQLPI